MHLGAPFVEQKIGNCGFLGGFPRQEDGNTAIDWVVLTSGMVLLGATVGLAISSPADEVVASIKASLEAMDSADD